MNKIYKLVWSKAKNMWVVASELAKSYTKSPNSGIIGFVSMASLESKINMDLSKGFVAGVFPMVNRPVAKLFDFKITVAAIVKNEAENVPQWVNAARSCADEIVVVDTGSTDGTVERFRDYGIQCFHYDWHDDFASAKNYMISLCHGDWIVLLDGDEWFREGCDVRKAIAKHHGNPITKAIIADWICLDKDRGNTVMFSGGAVRAFRNQPDVRYFRKVHENLTINYENFAFEPDFKMYHTGYSGSVNRSKHERNLRIMRTMFDFDNGKVEFPTDWRYIEDTYAGLGQFDKALWAADKMISYGVQEYSAAAWITKFNVLFAMRTSLEEMRKQFDYCFSTVPSVSGFRFLASIYFFRNGLVAEGLDNYIEGLRMLMGPQDKVAQEHTYWRMYMPEASTLASAVYLQNKQVEAALYVCKVSEQYCGKTTWTDGVLRDIYNVVGDIGHTPFNWVKDSVLSSLFVAKRGVLAGAFLSSVIIGTLAVTNEVYAVGPCTVAACVSGGQYNTASGTNSSVSGGYWNTALGCNSSISGGQCNKASGESSSVSGGYWNIASDCYSSVSGGGWNIASCFASSVSGGSDNTASGYASWVTGGCCGIAYARYSSVIGGGIAGASACDQTALGSVAIGKNATTTRDYEIAIGSQCAPVTIGGNLTVTGTQTITDGTTTKTWSDVLAGGSDGNSVTHLYAGNGTAANAATTSGSTMLTIADGTTVRDSITIKGSGYTTVTSNAEGVITINSWMGNVLGSNNTATCYGTTVTGGTNNETSGPYASVTGGCYNIASGCISTVTGGSYNKANGEGSAINGGCANIACGCYSYITGGSCNSVAISGCYSSIFGGSRNSSEARYTSIVGGSVNKTSGNGASIVGGSCNIASGGTSSIVGGCQNVAGGDYSLISGGMLNRTGTYYSYFDDNNVLQLVSPLDSRITMPTCSYYSPTITVSVPIYDSSTGEQTGSEDKSYTLSNINGDLSSVFGGKSNASAGNYSTVSGGFSNVAVGDYSLISGGQFNQSIGEGSSVFGGSCNIANGKGATVIGGYCNTAIPLLKYSYTTSTGSQGFLNSNVVDRAIANASSITFAGRTYDFQGYAYGDNGEIIGYEFVSGYYHSATLIPSTRQGSVVVGGVCNLSTGEASLAVGGCSGQAYADYSTAIGGGITGNACCATTAIGSVAIGKCAATTRDYEVAIGSSCAPVKIAGNLTVTGTNTVSNGTTTKSWTELLSGGSPCFANGVVLAGCNNTASGCYSSVSGGSWNTACGVNASISGGNCNTASGSSSSVSGGEGNKASGIVSSVNGGIYNTASCFYALVSGGCCNTASGDSSSVSGGYCNIASGNYSSVVGGTNGAAYANFSTVIGGGQTGISSCSLTAQRSVAIGKNATTTRDYEIAIGSSCAPVKIDGALTVDGAKTVTDGTTTKTWSDVLAGSSLPNNLVTTEQLNNRVNIDNDSVIIGSCITVQPWFSGTCLSNNIIVGNCLLSNSPNTTIIGNNSSSNIYGNNSILLGNDISSKRHTSIAIGYNAQVLGTRGSYQEDWTGNSIAIGTCASVDNNWSIAFGYNASNIGEDSVAIGSSSTANSSNSIAIGSSSYVDSGRSIAIGNLSTVNYNSWDSIAIGSAVVGNIIDNNPISAEHSVALGNCSKVSGKNAVAIGYCSLAVGGKSIAIGYNAYAYGQYYSPNQQYQYGENIAIGNNANAQREYAVSIGSYATAGERAVSFGNNANASCFAVALGYNTNASICSIAIGSNARTSDSNSIALGYASHSSLGNIAIGKQAKADYTNVISIGNSNSNGYQLSYSDSSAISLYNQCIAAGGFEQFKQNRIQYYISEYGISEEEANTYFNYDYEGFVRDISSDDLSAILNGSYTPPVTGDSLSNIILGNCNSLGSRSSLVTNSTVIGNNSVITGVSSVAIGDNTKVLASNSIALGVNSEATEENTLSVGSSTLKRRIVNVADGTAVHDVVTVGQLNTAIASIDIPTNGVVESGNTGLVTGNTVYEALESRIGQITVENNAQNTVAVGDGSSVSGDGAVAVGSGSSGSGEGSVAVGGTSISSGEGSVAVGDTSSSSGQGSVAVGSNTIAESDNTVVIGTGSTVSGTDSGNSVAIGQQTSVTGSDSVALGGGSSVTGTESTAVGGNTVVNNSSSVALGYNSNASNDNVVSVGHKSTDTDSDGNTYGSDLTRRIINVADGVDAHDVVTVGQMNQQLATINNYNTSLDGRIGTLASDGNYIRSSATNDVAANLIVLDTQLKATDIAAIKYDGDDHALATLGGTNGTVLRNVKNGVVNETSMDAVNGSQLHAVKQDILGFADDIRANTNNIRSTNESVSSLLRTITSSDDYFETFTNLKADVSLGNLTDAGKRVLKTYAEDAVATYLAQQGLSVPAAPMAMNTNNSNTLSVTNAGNGSLHVGEGSYVNGTSSIAIGVGNQVNANNSGAFGDPSIINADESYVLGNDDTINTGATGSFIVGNDGVSDAKGGLLFGSNTKATVEAKDAIGLGNRTEVSAKGAIALGSDSIADTENILSIGNSNLKRKIVNVADGDISQNSSEAVTGAQLFVTNEKVQKNTEALEKKADVDAGNINVSDWATKLGVGKVENGNANLVTGGTVYDAIQGIKGNDLVQTNGDVITIGANNTASVIDVSDSMGQGRKITGVITDVNDATSAANVGYVNAITDNIVKSTNSVIQRVDNKVNKVGANAAAIANLPTPPFDGEEKWAFAAGVGHYQGETAGAVGAFYRPTDNVIARVSGSFGNGDEMVGAGVAVSLNKGNTPAVSKAQMVRTINAQAERIQSLESNRSADREQIERQNAVIADMQQAMVRMQEELAELKAK